ncbi:DNA-processing protein DprA [Domibacillus indicus]|uniref:DNA-processing protein DprA n=1 Tax=Domibacillus indicus TaxID=1437523 RepID=UPI0006183012|nr:DNA-processing protein DprA [Domibacillus indicus]
MDETTKWLLKLQYCENITWKDQYLLLKNDPHLTSLSRMSSEEYAHITGRSTQQAALILQNLCSLSTNHLCTSLRELSSTFIPIYHKLYPDQLKRLPQPPWGLFAMGNINLLADETMLAVVGSRNGSQYGKEALQVIIPSLVEKKVSIVSGLARGIDAFSHELALQAGGRTIAVIAGGFKHFYPRENRELAQRISKQGLLLSEYAPDKRPEKWQFPARNRIISGLSKGVLVVQAAKKSGSLITAAFAMEQGIEVFAVPGPIMHPLSEGVHSLIADGAKIVHSADDILVEIKKE